MWRLVIQRSLRHSVCSVLSLERRRGDHRESRLGSLYGSQSTDLECRSEILRGTVSSGPTRARASCSSMPCATMQLGPLYRLVECFRFRPQGKGDLSYYKGTVPPSRPTP